MALQTSGQISLNDIHVEAGGSSGSQASINDTDIRSLIGKNSGAQMSFSEWYGASAGPSPSTITSWSVSGAQTGGFPDYGYLKGTNDTLVVGTVFGQPMKYYTFGTNNRLSDWGSGTPSFVDFPGMRYSTGNRAFSIGVVEDGTQRFVVPTENWLGYTTGMYMKVYEANGSSGVTGKSAWSYAFNDQTSNTGIWMDPLNPRNGVCCTNYLNNVSYYNDIHAFFFQVSTDGTSLSIQSYQRLSSGGTSDPYNCIDALYRGGRFVIFAGRGGSNVRQRSIISATVNTSTGHMSSVGSPVLIKNNSYTYVGEYTNQCLFYLDGQFCVLYANDSGSTNMQLAPINFSGNTASLGTSVVTGLNPNTSRYQNRYVIGENTDTSNKQVYIAHYNSSSDWCEEVWENNNGTLTKTWENTTEADTVYKTVNNGYASADGYGYMGSHRANQTGQRGKHATYTKDDRVLRQCLAHKADGSRYSSNPLLMPWYWNH